MKLIVRPGGGLAGRIAPPGDKSITHRAILLGLLAEGGVTISGGNLGADCASSLDCARALGATVIDSDGSWSVRADGLAEPAGVLDCGNSGTTLRLLPGILAAQPFFSVLTGDASLVRRPVDRILVPLRAMGASLWARDGDRLPPLAIRGAALKPIRFQLPVASAQVASCLMLAALGARGESEIEIPGPARDHTERMLRGAGIELEVTPSISGGRRVRIAGPGRPRGGALRIPGDFSAAAFFLAAAAAVPGARVTAAGVGMNPTRIGLLDALVRMGADVAVDAAREEMGEPVADVTVTGPERLSAIEIPVAWVPRMIDEVPAWAIAASAASGISRLRGAAELRVKESDRIALIARNLHRLGIAARELEDGLEIEGGRPRGGEVEADGDHRIAMAFAMMGLFSDGPVTIDDASSVPTSYPGFARDLAALGGTVG